MLKFGITGGIGSGKSTVAHIFETLGIPVYYADDAAKKATINPVKYSNHSVTDMGNMYKADEEEVKRIMLILHNHS